MKTLVWKENVKDKYGFRISDTERTENGTLPVYRSYPRFLMKWGKATSIQQRYKVPNWTSGSVHTRL